MTCPAPVRTMILRATIVAATASVVLGAAGLAAALPTRLPPSASDSAQQVLRGTVSSGSGAASRAVGLAQVVVYASARTGTQVLGRTHTDADGHFSLAIPREVRSRYVTATVDRHRTLVTMLGTTLPGRISVNEMTTVAAAYASAQLARGTMIAGTDLQLESAAGMAANLVSPTSGMPSQVITSPPNANETNTWRELGTLANILAACVRAEPGAAACTRLFALARTTAQPTTWHAVLAIARNPARDVSAIYALGDHAHVFRPYLPAALGPAARSKWTRLDAFTLAVKVNATGRAQDGKEVCPFGGPGNLAFDLRGYAWITNNVVQGTPNSANCIIVLRPDGKPADGRAGAPSSPVQGAGILGQGFGLGFDPRGRL
ncbi:MAG: hypothetical protein PHU75_07710 [Candidatus Nanopelagicales bacterium]|nr:hypothetical protein [Candidatus Nanopelagicales bacterium]